MTLSRRRLLASGALAATTAAIGGARLAAAAPPPLIVYDGRRAASRAFAHGRAGPRIDIAREEATLWRTLRSLSADGAITGLTGWSDWVLVRGMLEDRGKRVIREAKAGRLFQWTME